MSTSRNAMVGARKVHMLKFFVLPAFNVYTERWKSKQSSELYRDAPAAMFFHCDEFEPAGDEACMIAAFHAVLENLRVHNNGLSKI